MGSESAGHTRVTQDNIGMNHIKQAAAAIMWGVGAGPLLRAFFEPETLIIAYHNIGESSRYGHITVTAEDFEKQLVYLKSRGYTFCRFRDLVTTPGKRVCVYFDDGFKSVFDVAYPILKKHSIPATVFLTTSYVNQESEKDIYARWGDAQKTQDIFEFASHSNRHIKLNKIPLAEAEMEMRESKKIIEEKLSTSVVSFSYPYGRSSEALEGVAKKIGYAYTTADKRFHKARPDPDDSSAIFKLKTGVSWL